MTREPIPTTNFNWTFLRRAYAYLRPYWKLTALAYFLALLITGLSVAIPQFIRWMVDEGIAGGNLSLLTQAVLALLGLTLLRGLFTFFQGQWSEVASQSVAYDVRNDIERQLLALSFSYHDRTESWFEVVSFTPLPRVDLRPLAARLQALEGAVDRDDARWCADPPNLPVPELWFGRDEPQAVAEHRGAPDIAVGALAQARDRGFVELADHPVETIGELVDVRGPVVRP